MENKAEKRRKRIFDIIQIGQMEDFPSRNFDIVTVAAIVVNLTVLFLGTFEELARYDMVFDILEGITVTFFCVEYFLRIWTADFLYPGMGRVRAALRFMVSFDGIVDLFTILPFFFLYGFAALRILRVVRIFHLVRINAYYDSFNVITSVLYEKKNQIFSSVLIILILMAASSLCMYSAEHEAQPEVFRNAFSGLWWSMSTIFTVGYGDIYPVTLVGRVMAVITTFLGVGAVAIPTGIISAGFVEQYTRLSREETLEGYRQSTAVLYIDGESPLCGLRIREAEEREGILATALIRDGAVLVAADALALRDGDTLVCMKERQ